MKLCIPSAEANGLESVIEPHFPNASHLIIFDTETREHATLTIGEEAEPTPIDAIICASINRAMLQHLLEQGITVYGSKAEQVNEAIGQFERGELQAAGMPQGGGCCGGHGGCGGHEHEEEHECCGDHDHDDDHECCGGKGHDDPDHECCGGKGHDDPNHECCGGKGHGHQHGGCGCSH